MRILMLSYGYPPVVGGAEQHVRNLSIELAARGHDVAVATLWREGRPDMSIDEGVRVYYVRGTVHRLAQLLFSVPGRLYAPPFPDPELVLNLRRVTDQERPDIVHAHNWLLHSFLPLRGWSHARLVETFHSYGLTCPNWNLMYRDRLCSGPSLSKCPSCAVRKYGVLKGLLTVCARWASTGIERRAVARFISVSSAVEKGNALHNSRWSSQVIPNFVPDDIAARRDEHSPLLDDLPEEPYLLFVGTLTRTKGLSQLLEAYRLLHDAPPLVLIGAKWPDTPVELPPKVAMLHDWPHSAVMTAWHRSMIGIIPSIWPEPCATVIMEAMSCGKPVVATRVGGSVDLVADGETGMLVPPGNVEALREALQYLLDSPDVRQRMGEAARQRVTCFQAGTVVSQIERVYHEVLGA